MPPHPELLQQSFTVNLGPSQWKPQIVARIAPHLREQKREYKLFVMVNTVLQHDGGRTTRGDPVQAGDLVFDISLHQGVNTIEVWMIAALPKGQAMPNGADAVVEKITVLANVAKY